MQEPATDNQLDIAPQDVSNPIVVPIDDASEVMTQVDDNSSEAEALDLLGLDETGNIVAAGHQFTWSDGTGATATTTVDAATGDYAFESSDGFTYRRIDGTTYAGRNGVAWTEVDDGTGLDSVQRLGLDGPVTIDQIIDPLIDDYSSSVTNQRGDGTSAVSAEIDSHGLWNDHSLARLTWLAQMGIPNSEVDVEPGSIIVVDASVGTDGRTVETLTVTTPTFTSTYVLDEMFETAPVIDLPEL